MSGEELRALAEAATPGDWKSTEANGGSQAERRALGSFSLIHNGKSEVALVRGFSSERERDAAFIAAANPTAVLAMLDERDALRAQVERVRALADKADRDASRLRVGSYVYVAHLRAALDGPA